MLHKFYCYGSIFALCAIFFALLGCRSTTPPIVQQTQNIAFDTITVRDTTHEHFTERTYTKEIWHVDTSHGQRIKESYIVHEQQKNMDGNHITSSAQNSTSTQHVRQQPDKKKSNLSPIFIVLIGFSIVFLILCFLFRRKKLV